MMNMYIFLTKEGFSMNIRIVYCSKTGHSKKIAEGISKALSVPAENMSKLTGPVKADLLFLVTGIYGGKCNPAVLTLIQSLTPESIGQVALVTSSMSKGTQTEIKEALTAQGIPIYPEEYRCKGSFLFFSLGHPSTDEVQEAVEFSLRAAKSAEAAR